MSQSGDGEHEVDAGYDPDTDTFHATFDPDSPGSLCGAVIYLVSVATGKKPDTMTPLFESVDPDAFEAVFRPGSREDVSVEFEFCGCEVTATGDGVVRVTPSERS